MLVICDRNDIGLYYKDTIMTELALARSINYDCRIFINDKLKHNLRSYKTFIVHATGACAIKVLQS